MSRTLAAVALAGALVTGVAPAKADDAMIVMGPGTMNCMQFSALRRQPQPVAQAAENDFFFWAQGIMSGINMGKEAMGQPTKNLSSIDIDDQRQLLREYCNAHPTKTYMDGVIDLLNQLNNSSGE